jgi:hypothetical protein
MRTQMTNSRDCLLWAGKALLLLTSLACNSETTISGTTNWVRCATDTECENYEGSSCSGEGYCLDAEGERLEVASSVTLRAVMSETSPGGPQGIAAEWTNGSDETIFLRGCMTADGWYREGSEWLEYGAFAQCAVEGTAVEVAAGATYLDISALPPERGDNVWRLVGPYGVGCTPGEPLSQASCASTFELTSSNEVSP